MLVLQVMVNGILLGGLYGIMAIGMSVIWDVMNIVNIAHPQVLLGGRAGWPGHHDGGPS